MTIHPLHALRAVALRTQSLHSANVAESNLSRGSSSRRSSGVSRPAVKGLTRDALYEVVNRLGCVQIDTINVIRRSHYLVLWSRLGNYDPSDLDALSSPVDRHLFEGWQHAASLIPLTEYRYQMPHQRYLRGHPAPMSVKWLAESGSAALLEQVRERIRQNSAVRGGDFEYDGPKRASWWDWKPAKNAL